MGACVSHSFKRVHDGDLPDLLARRLDTPDPDLDSPQGISLCWGDILLVISVKRLISIRSPTRHVCPDVKCDDATENDVLADSGTLERLGRAGIGEYLPESIRRL